MKFFLIALSLASLAIGLNSHATEPCQKPIYYRGKIMNLEAGGSAAGESSAKFQLLPEGAKSIIEEVSFRFNLNMPANKDMFEVVRTAFLKGSMVIINGQSCSSMKAQQLPGGALSLPVFFNNSERWEVDSVHTYEPKLFGDSSKQTEPKDSPNRAEPVENMF